MTAGDQRDSVHGRDAAPDTATGRTAAEEETIPPPHRAGSNPAPKTTPGNIDLPSRLGRYEITECLGRGAMGAVFLAHDTELDRKVALKVPLGDTSEGSEWLERFRREARAAGALRHANICPIFDVAEIDGFHLIAMAFVEGALSQRSSGPAGRSWSGEPCRSFGKLPLLWQTLTSKGLFTAT